MVFLCEKQGGIFMLLGKQTCGQQTPMRKIKSKMFYTVLSVLLLFCACSVKGNEKEIVNDISSDIQTELTVCAEESFRNSLKPVFDAFTGKYKIKISVEWVPALGSFSTDKSDERTSYLQRLKTQILAGDGPDVFIVSTSGTDFDILPNMERLMHNGVFQELDKILIENTFEFEDVNSILLEAGQANGTQYVLPLCFQIDGILLCDTSESNLRMEKDLENMSTMQFYSYIDDRYPEWRVQGQWHENLNNNMDAPVNFEDMNVDLFVHELPELLQREVDSLNTKGIYRIPDLNAYLKEGAIIDSPNGLPYIWGPVSRYLDYAAMALINRTTPILIPIPNADGQIYARITGIAAISRNCKNTTASELLLTFLISDRWQKKGTDVGSTVLYGFPIKKSAMKSWFQDETLTYLDKLPCERLNGQTLESFIIWYDKIEGAYFSFRPKEIAQLIYTNAETEQRISVEELKKVEEILKRQLSE